MKQAYYFSHDSNARHDQKVLAMRSVYGYQGYGWYWALIEMLSETDGYQLDYADDVSRNAIAYELQCERIKLDDFVSDCINKFKLFNGNGNQFWSESLRRRLELAADKSRKARDSANARWHKSESNNANAMPTQCEGNAIKESKESKVKKVNKDIAPIVIPEYINPETWSAFLEMRSKMKSPPTGRAIELLFKKLLDLKNLGNNPDEVLNQSIMNNWKDVYAIKNAGLQSKADDKWLVR